MDVHEKRNRYQILQFKQTTKYVNSRKLHKTSKQNNTKPNKYNIKPGKMEKHVKGTNKISWEKSRL